MRIYTIVLCDVVSEDSHIKFSKFIDEKNFEWWRYSALNWILCTPDDVYTNSLMVIISECYHNVGFLILEVDIKDVGGIFPVPKEISNLDPTWSPVSWFYSIADKNFVPKWEKIKNP